MTSEVEEQFRRAALEVVVKQIEWTRASDEVDRAVRDLAKAGLVDEEGKPTDESTGSVEGHAFALARLLKERHAAHKRYRLASDGLVHLLVAHEIAPLSELHYP